jgi:hypothetical protein
MTNWSKNSFPLWTAAARGLHDPPRVAPAVAMPTPRETELAARLADETAARERAEKAMDAANRAADEAYATALKRFEDAGSDAATKADLAAVLRILRKIGGYMSPEDQQVVWAAMWRVK